MTLNRWSKVESAVKRYCRENSIEGVQTLLKVKDIKYTKHRSYNLIVNGEEFEIYVGTRSLKTNYDAMYREMISIIKSKF